jgi:iron complex transport system permease protein
MPLTPARTFNVLLILAVLLLAVSAASLSVGSVDISLSRLLTGAGLSETDQTILLGIRLPRTLLAIAVGSGLSIAGVVFQALLRNPLAEPFILGISSGGTAGTILALSISAAAAMIVAPLASFAGCASVMALVYALGHRHGRLDTYSLLLAGVMVGAFFHALVLIGFSVMDRDVRGAFLWLMGNLGGARMDSLLVVGIPLFLAGLFLIANSRTFNLIAVGDETASQLGVDVHRFSRLAYLVASLVTGLAVSLSGVIGFVGLVVPHVCRLLFGPDHRLLLPASLLAGAVFLVSADTLARVVISPAEIPVGAVTAAIGAPLFMYLLKRS